MPETTRRTVGQWLGILPLLLGCVSAASQPASGESIHWAYSAYFGTGRYDLGNERTYVLGVRPGWRWRESSLGVDGERRLGFRFRLPVAVGTHDLLTDRPLANLDQNSVSTVSVVPGVEIEIPLTERWTIKPVAYLGAGTEIGGGTSAWVHWVGLKTRFVFGGADRRWMLVNSLTRVGYSPDTGPAGRALPLMTGVELRHPIADKRIGGDPVYLHWEISYTDYLDELALDRGLDDAATVGIDSAWELGVAFSKGGRRLGLWRLRLDRVGLAYRFDSSGDFDGVRVVFSSLFDR